MLSLAHLQRNKCFNVKSNNNLFKKTLGSTNNLSGLFGWFFYWK